MSNRRSACESLTSELTDTTFEATVVTISALRAAFGM